MAGSRIKYRVVDEYEGETLLDDTERSSDQPLTLGELETFFLGAWSFMDVLQSNFEDDVNGMLGFFRQNLNFTLNSVICYGNELSRASVVRISTSRWAAFTMLRSYSAPRPAIPALPGSRPHCNRGYAVLLRRPGS